MFPYRAKYTESESDIKNYNSLYKNTKKAKTLPKKTKKKSENFKIFKNPKFYLAFSTRSTIRIFYYFFRLITVFEKNECWKISKTQTFILYYIYVP